MPRSNKFTNLCYLFQLGLTKSQDTMVGIPGRIKVINDEKITQRIKRINKRQRFDKGLTKV